MEESSPFRRYYTPEEVASHDQENDCWASWRGKVYNLTSLIAQFEEEESVRPLVESGGKDISDWFDEDGELKLRVDPKTGLSIPSAFQCGCVHVPPPFPTSDWRNDFGAAWWKDSTYCIGNLTKKTRRIRVINTLSHQDDIVQVCSEETITEIMTRYQYFNKHADQYVWKRKGNLLQMDKTLEENGILDEDELYKELGLSDEVYFPALHVYFNNYQVTSI